VVVVALLLLFVGGILAALRRGETPDCHCFGQIHSEPVGNETLIRNLALLAGGLFVAFAGPGPSPGGWARAASGSVIALGFTSFGLVVLLYTCGTLWKENRRLSGRSAQPDMVRPLEAGAAAPDFSVADLTGTVISSQELLAVDRRTVIVFTSATCGPCVHLLPELAEWRDMLAGRLGIHVVAAGDEAENRRLAAGHELSVLLDPPSSVAAAFGITATPSAIEIDVAGRVSGPPAAGAPAIEGLIRAALKRRGSDGPSEKLRDDPSSAPRSVAPSA
jgi:peroxiredoxin